MIELADKIRKKLEVAKMQANHSTKSWKKMTKTLSPV